MAAVDWRAIRVADCEISVSTRSVLARDHGPAVTLGALASKTDAELVRSPNIGRRSLREVREMIDTMKACYPELPPIFEPSAEIDWSLLARAVDFYRAKGYAYAEAPWVIDDQTIAITATEEAWRAPGRMGLGTLVGSAEQGFLHLERTGKLETGRTFVACTPCFRPAEIVDDIHFPYFMKVELISFHADPALQEAAISAEERQDGVQVTFGAQLQGMLGMLQDAGACFRALGAHPSMLKTEQTDQGVDILINGIEVGSYGMRRHRYADGDEVSWTYGTGLALPRFSQALARA